MKQSLLALALLGVSIESVYGAEAQAKVEAKVEAKAQAKVEAKVESKAEAKEKDYFYAPFQQMLAQNYAVDQTQQSEQQVQQFDVLKSIDSAKTAVQNEAAPVAAKAVEKVVEQVNKIEEKDKKAFKEQAVKAADAIQKEAASALKNTKAILESPEANIISKVAGEKVEEKQKSATNIVNDALQNPVIVGNHGSMTQNQQPQNQQYEGPPIVSAIQAIDQYGNVMATAQNPKLYEMMKQYQLSQSQQQQQQQQPQQQPQQNAQQQMPPQQQFVQQTQMQAPFVTPAQVSAMVSSQVNTTTPAPAAPAQLAQAPKPVATQAPVSQKQETTPVDQPVVVQSPQQPPKLVQKKKTKKVAAKKEQANPQAQAQAPQQAANPFQQQMMMMQHYNFMPAMGQQLTQMPFMPMQNPMFLGLNPYQPQPQPFMMPQQQQQPAAPVDDSELVQNQQDINTSVPKEVLLLEQKMHKTQQPMFPPVNNQFMQTPPPYMMPPPQFPMMYPPQFSQMPPPQFAPPQFMSQAPPLQQSAKKMKSLAQQENKAVQGVQKAAQNMIRVPEPMGLPEMI